MGRRRQRDTWKDENKNLGVLQAALKRIATWRSQGPEANVSKSKIPSDAMIKKKKKIPSVTSLLSK